MRSNPLTNFLAAFGVVALLFLVVFSIGIMSLVRNVSSLVENRDQPQEVIGRTVIGVVEVEGMMMSSKKTIRQLNAFADDNDVKGIIVRLDTPGGGPAPAQEIFEKIVKIRKRKPVFASMANVAASGGYYVAAACEVIVANPSTLTASIGVISQTVNAQRLLKHIKIDARVYKAGKFKDIMSPLRPATGDEETMIQSMLDDIHEQFKADIARVRKIAPSALETVADGRVLTGRQAKAANLVDQLGGLEDTAQALATRYSFQNPWLLRYPKNKRFNSLNELLKDLSETAANSMVHAFTGVDKMIVR